MPERTDDLAKVRSLVDNAQFCMLTSMTADGRHVSRPMAVQDVEFDGDLWFFTYDDSDKAREIARHPQVNVAFANEGDGEWTSLTGTAELVHDRALAERYWAKPLKAWFPDELDTPGLALLKVHADSVEYWDSPSSKVVRLVGMARAAVSGDPDKFPGENREISL